MEGKKSGRQVLAVCGLTVASVHLLKVELRHRPHLLDLFILPFIFLNLTLYLHLLLHLCPQSYHLVPSIVPVDAVSDRTSARHQGWSSRHTGWVHHTIPVSIAVQSTDDHIPHVLAGLSTTNKPRT